MSEVTRYYIRVSGGKPRLVEASAAYLAETGFTGLVKGDDYAALEAECSDLRLMAEDRDQQYDMKVKARAQRDAAVAECERLRDQAAMFVWLRDKCHLFDHYRAMKHRPNAFEQEVRSAMLADAALSAKP